MTQIVRIAHSPDSDDAFMFYAMAREKIRLPGIRFEHVLSDIETLNLAAKEGRYEVSAISIHAYAHLADRYQLMPCGASMGEGYGPIVVAREPLTGLAGKRVGVPGAWTSAALATRLYAPEHEAVIMPFDAVEAAVLAGEVDAGVIIHEGQLTYADQGLICVADLGVWWAAEQDGLPLPLGGNVIRRDLGEDLVQAVTQAVSDSIAYALDHPAEALAYAAEFAGDLDPERTERFVRMYVNQRTLDYGPEGREAIRRFLSLAEDRGLIPAGVGEVDLVQLTKPRGEAAAALAQ